MLWLLDSFIRDLKVILRFTSEACLKKCLIPWPKEKEKKYFTLTLIILPLMRI